jgi:hypothetical protein
LERFHFSDAGNLLLTTDARPGEMLAHSLYGHTSLGRWQAGEQQLEERVAVCLEACVRIALAFDDSG